MYSCLSLHTHYSLLRAVTKPSEAIDSAAKLEIPAMAITDYDSMGGIVDFSEKAKKKKIKAVLGTKIWVNDNLGGGYVTILAKNKKGLQNLMNLSSKSHDLEHNIQRPGVSFDELSELKDCMVSIGEPDSPIYNSVIKNNSVYYHKDPSAYLQSFLNADYEKTIARLIDKYVATFGGNFYISINSVNDDICKIDAIINDILVDKGQGYKICGVPSIHYQTTKNKTIHDILLASFYKTTVDSLHAQFSSEELGQFYRFNSTKNFIPNSTEMKSWYEEPYRKTADEVVDMIEDYTILSNPNLPSFDCPDNKTEDAYLRELCRVGWTNLKDRFDQNRIPEYVDRIKMELDVFTEANLAGYFLIVQDYINHAKSQGILVGPGRGSACGSLASYLLGITTIDPIINELYFERFYNKGRNSGGNISLPDIDSDFPKYYREKIIRYSKEKYGDDYVSQVVTFSSLQGSSAIREVLRAYKALPPEQINDLSKLLPKKAAIADKMEEEKETSIIRWVLKNDPKKVEDYCRLDETGNTVGDLSLYFNYAIEVEGTYKSYGKHASAIVISKFPISSITPMIADKKSGEPMAGIEFKGLEKMGLGKFDFLGVSVLDKSMRSNELLRYGKIRTDIELEQEQDEE